jgi:predicted dehydrogenase
MEKSPLMTPVRLALIGLGNQGQEHLAAAKNTSQVRFVAGVDTNQAARDDTARNHADLGMLLFDDVNQLDSSQLDGLVLALPHHCYDGIWDTLLGFHLPILKEKPLGRSFDEAVSLLQRANMARCPVQTAIQRRHHPSYRMLKQMLDKQDVRVSEIHAHLHLGFAATKSGHDSWRENRQQAGGGALLDAGYHLVDLLHFLAGQFDLITAALWCGDRAATEKEIEDRAWLTGRNEQCWFMLDSWCAGHVAPGTAKPQKSEGVVLHTDQGIWRANRDGVWHDGIQLGSSSRDWLEAMSEQLGSFAKNIRTSQWHESTIWDQLPAMRVIDSAYRIATLY